MYPEADWKPWAFDAIGYLGGGGGANSMVVEKTPRPDLTARQIEWCRANIPMFAEMQRLRGVK